MITTTDITLKRSFDFNVIQSETVSKAPKGCLTVEEFGNETRKKLKTYCQKNGIS